MKFTSECNCGCGGATTVHRGEPRKFIRGHNNRGLRENQTSQWKGNKVSYRSLHHWVESRKAKTGRCQACKRKLKTTWANLSGRYKRDLSDYIELCWSCHKFFDSPLEGRREGILERVAA